MNAIFKVVNDQYAHYPLGEGIDMILDSKGYPHIMSISKPSPTPFGNAKTLVYSYWDGTNWRHERVDFALVDFGWQFGTKPSIALDSDENPGIAYIKRYGDFTKVTYAYRSGTGWIKEEIDDYLPQGILPDLKFHASASLKFRGKTPHIIYSGNYLWGQDLLPGLWHAYKKIDGTWEKKLLAGSGLGIVIAQNIETDMDLAGNIHITHGFCGGLAIGGVTCWAGYAMVDAVAGNLKEGYSKTFEAKSFLSSIKYGSDGWVYVSYYHVDSKSLKVAKGQGDNWIIETVDTNLGLPVDEDTGISGMLFSSIDEKNGIVKVSYYDYNNKVLKLATRQSGGWERDIIDVDIDLGAYNALALNANGQAKITYFDGFNNELLYFQEENRNKVAPNEDPNQTESPLCNSIFKKYEQSTSPVTTNFYNNLTSFEFNRCTFISNLLGRTGFFNFLFSLLNRWTITIDGGVNEIIFTDPINYLTVDDIFRISINLNAEVINIYTENQPGELWIDRIDIDERIEDVREPGDLILTVWDLYWGQTVGKLRIEINEEGNSYTFYILGTNSAGNVSDLTNVPIKEYKNYLSCLWDSLIDEVLLYISIKTGISIYTLENMTFAQLIQELSNLVTISNPLLVIHNSLTSLKNSFTPPFEIKTKDIKAEISSYLVRFGTLDSSNGVDFSFSGTGTTQGTLNLGIKFPWVQVQGVIKEVWDVPCNENFVLDIRSNPTLRFYPYIIGSYPHKIFYHQVIEPNVIDYSYSYNGICSSVLELVSFGIADFGINYLLDNAIDNFLTTYNQIEFNVSTEFLSQMEEILEISGFDYSSIENNTFESVLFTSDRIRIYYRE